MFDILSDRMQERHNDDVLCVDCAMGARCSISDRIQKRLRDTPPVRCLQDARTAYVYNDQQSVGCKIHCVSSTELQTRINEHRISYFISSTVGFIFCGMKVSLRVR